jgi:hypothetical protein
MVPPYQPMSAASATAATCSVRSRPPCLATFSENTCAACAFARRIASCGVHTVSSAMNAARSPSVAVSVVRASTFHFATGCSISVTPASISGGSQRRAVAPSQAWLTSTVSVAWPSSARAICATWATSCAGSRAPILSLKMRWRRCSRRSCASSMSRTCRRWPASRPAAGWPGGARPEAATPAGPACAPRRRSAPSRRRSSRRRCRGRPGPCAPARRRSGRRLPQQRGRQVVFDGVQDALGRLLVPRRAADGGRLAEAAGAVASQSCTITGLWRLMAPKASLCGRIVGMSRMRASMRSMGQHRVSAGAVGGVACRHVKGECKIRSNDIFSMNRSMTSNEPLALPCTDGTPPAALLPRHRRDRAPHAVGSEPVRHAEHAVARPAPARGGTAGAAVRAARARACGCRRPAPSSAATLRAR